MTEQKIIRESYKEHIKNLKEICILEYLEKGYNLYTDSILKAIEFYKSCLPIEFKEELLKQSLWDLYYNKPMGDLFIKKFNITKEEHIKAIGTFVYSFQSDKREFEEREDENILKEKLLKEGFKEQLTFSRNEEENIKIREELKKLNDLKVICVFDKDKIGFMGSFTEKEKHEGKLIFNDDKKFIAFLPKRHTRTGQILTSKFYYKVLTK